MFRNILETSSKFNFATRRIYYRFFLYTCLTLGRWIVELRVDFRINFRIEFYWMCGLSLDLCVHIGNVGFSNQCYRSSYWFKYQSNWATVWLWVSWLLKAVLSWSCGASDAILFVCVYVFLCMCESFEYSHFIGPIGWSFCSLSDNEMKTEHAYSEHFQ